MDDFITAVGLVLLIEGAIYAAFPGLGRQVGEVMRSMPEDRMRIIALCAAVLGLVIIWLVRG